MIDRLLQTFARRFPRWHYCIHCGKLGRALWFRSAHTCFGCWHDALDIVHSEGFCLVDAR